MTIDERLEALTQSLELFVSITQSTFEQMTERMNERDERLKEQDERSKERGEHLDRMLEDLIANQDRLEDSIDQMGQRIDHMGQRMDDMTIKIIGPIARLALAHEQRLNRLDPEGRIPDSPTQ
jgi:acetate kinase